MRLRAGSPMANFTVGSACNGIPHFKRFIYIPATIGFSSSLFVSSSIIDFANVELEKNMTFLVVQEVEGDRLLCAVDETETLYSVPNWFGDTEIKPGTYILVKHADNSLQTSPLQFGFIYSMNYYTETGSVIEGVKP